MDIQAFNGAGNAAGTFAATASSQSAALPGVMNGNQVYVYNGANDIAHFRVTKGASTAVLTDTFVAPGTSHTFSINPEGDTISVICEGTGTGKFAYQRGFGL